MAGTSLHTGDVACLRALRSGTSRSFPTTTHANVYSPSAHAPRIPCMHSVPHKPLRQRSTVTPCAGSNFGTDDFAPDKYGSFMSSEVVQEETNNIMRDYDQLMRLMAKFAGFDVEGKRIYCDQLESLCERLRIFNTRAKLSSDPMIKDALSNVNRQLLFMNTNLDNIHDGMVQQTVQLREITAAEASIANPEEVQRFRRRLADEFTNTHKAQDTLMNNMTMEKMAKDPGTFQTLMSEPRALAALQDVIQNASNIEKYSDTPALYQALKKLLDL